MSANPNEIVIEPRRRTRRYWSELWLYRELLYILAWRDIAVRYKQTVIGAVWALLKPALAILVFTVIFGRIARLPSDGVPYAILVCAAVLPWQLFAGALSDASASVVSNSGMISKIYFPRILVPTGAVLVNVVDFVVASLVVAILMAWYGYLPTWRIVFLPLLVLLACAAALGAGLWLAALNVKYRDFRYVVPFLLQLGLFVSPVGFSSTAIPENWKLVFFLNPMAGVIEVFRWALLEQGTVFYAPGFVLSFVMIGVLLIVGVQYFRRAERGFADII